MKGKLFEEITASFNDYDDDLLLELIRKGLGEGISPIDIMNHLSSLLEKIGEQFSTGELFLPDMVMAGDLMQECMEILKPAIMNNDSYVPSGKKILFGMVKGDVHDIGKNMVKMMWMSSGFEIVDLGIDVGADVFLEQAIKEKPDIIAVSSAMTTTVPSMRDTIDLLKSKGIDKDVPIIIGGGSANEELAKELGAYKYGGDDAYAALQIVKEILS